MSKIAIIGNIRFNFGYPTNHHKWIEIQNDYFKNVLYPTLISELSHDDQIILIGDTFETLHVLSPEILEHYILFLNSLNDIANVYIINGSKDIIKSKSKLYSLNTLSKLFPNTKVIDTITHFDNITLLPPKFTSMDLQTNPPLHEKILISNKKGTMLQHPIFNNYKLKMTTFKPNDISSIINIGNIIQMSDQEQEETVGIHIINTSTCEHIFIENLRSPKYITFNINTLEDIDNLVNTISKNHISLVISSDLINNDRSARRRIGILINERNFNSISYTIPEVIKEDKTETTKASIDPSIPFDTIIRQEIQNTTTIDNELLLKEYENVFRILNTKKE